MGTRTRLEIRTDMKVITQDGLITDLAWWAQMRVEGDSILLSDVRTVGENAMTDKDRENLEEADIATLVVASLPDEQQAVQDLFKDINAGIKVNKNAFDVSSWIDERRSA